MSQQLTSMRRTDPKSFGQAISESREKDEQKRNTTKEARRMKQSSQIQIILEAIHDPVPSVRVQEVSFEWLGS
jgi:hypothetical protein